MDGNYGGRFQAHGSLLLSGRSGDIVLERIKIKEHSLKSYSRFCQVCHAEKYKS